MLRVQAGQPGKRAKWILLVRQLQRMYLQLGCASDQQYVGRVGMSIRLIAAGAQMVLTLKMISAAVCYHDGLKPAKASTSHFNSIFTKLFHPLYAADPFCQLTSASSHNKTPSCWLASSLTQDAAHAVHHITNCVTIQPPLKLSLQSSAFYVKRLGA